MDCFKFIILIFVLKVLYDFSSWLYGYFLRFKWVCYFNTNNKNLTSYYYQIIKYLDTFPYEQVGAGIYESYNRQNVENLFIKTHGYYRHRFLQNFNPFYWINIIVFLPQKIIGYLNIRCKTKTVHLFNLIYWLISVIFTIYNNEITTYIKDLIKLLFNFFTKE